MATEFRLSDEDRAEYGGPEWVAFDVTKLDDLPLSELEVIEKAVEERNDGRSLLATMAYDFPRGNLVAKTILTWLARQQAGLITPKLADFDPKPRKIKVREVKPAGDTGPPKSSSPT